MWVDGCGLDEAGSEDGSVAATCERDTEPSASVQYGEFIDVRKVALFSLSFTVPDDHLLLSKRSDALFRLNRLQAALEDAEAVVRLCPAWGKVREFLYFYVRVRNVCTVTAWQKLGMINSDTGNMES
jgi:hypothetical protein